MPSQESVINIINDGTTGTGHVDGFLGSYMQQDIISVCFF